MCHWFVTAYLLFNSCTGTESHLWLKWCVNFYFWLKDVIKNPSEFLKENSNSKKVKEHVTVSEGWFYPFRSQHVLINFKLLGKAASTNMYAAVKSATRFQGLVKMCYDDDQIFNVD